MQRPAFVQARSQPGASRWALSADRVRDPFCLDPISQWWLAGLNRLGNQLNLFFTCNIDGNIRIPPLDLQPFVQNLTGEPMGIVVKGLVKDTNHDKPALASRRGLCELLTHHAANPRNLTPLPP